MTDSERYDPMDAVVRASLEEEADQVARRARTPEEMAAVMAPRLRARLALPFLNPGAMRLAWAFIVALLLVALAAAAVLVGSHQSIFSGRTVRIAVALSIGEASPNSQAILNGIRLAVAEAQGRAGSFAVEVPDASVVSDVAGGVADQSTGATAMRSIVADPSAIAVIGPYYSGIALAQIPIANQAGLLQCSPGNTAPFLTRPPESATLRPRPDQPTYVRVVVPDDALLARAADFSIDKLRARSVYVIDGDDPSLGGWFISELQRRGGALAGRADISQSGLGGRARALLADAAATKPAAIVFTGSPIDMALLVAAAPAAGLGATPFIGRDSLLDGDANVAGSFLNRAGSGASVVSAAYPAVADVARLESFRAAYAATYGGSPPPAAAEGYACAQVVLAALAMVSSAEPNLAGIRESVRVHGVDPDATFETLQGAISFDANGDVDGGQVTMFGFDAGSSDWVVREVLGP